MRFIRRVLKSAGQIETIFLFLALLVILATALMQAGADRRILLMRRELNDLERTWLDEAWARPELRPDIDSRSTLGGMGGFDWEAFGDLRRYDRILSGLLDELSALPAGATGRAEWAGAIGLFQSVFDRLYAIKKRMRFGYQSLFEMGLGLMAFALVLALAERFRHQRDMEALEEIRWLCGALRDPGEGGSSLEAAIEETCRSFARR